MDYTRIVFEKGVAIRRNQDGTWNFESQQVNLPRIVMEPTAVQQDLGLRPVVVTLPNEHQAVKMLLPFQQGRFLNIEHSISSRMMMFEKATDLENSFNAQYVLGALVYHSINLAERYCDTARKLALVPVEQEAVTDQEVMFSSHPEPYYEFDALLASVYRVYETSRHLLWKAFGNQGDTPKYLSEVLENAKNVPPVVLDRVRKSRNDFGNDAKKYRNSICHNHSLDFGMSTARGYPLSGFVWSVRMPIPDNPDAGSKYAYTYELNRDALDYGWELVSEIFDMMRVIIDNLPNK